MQVVERSEEFVVSLSRERERETDIAETDLGFYCVIHVMFPAA